MLIPDNYRGTTIVVQSPYSNVDHRAWILKPGTKWSLADHDNAKWRLHPYVQFTRSLLAHH